MGGAGLRIGGPAGRVLVGHAAHVVRRKGELVAARIEHGAHVGLLIAAHEAQQRAAPLRRDEAPLHAQVGGAQLDTTRPELADGAASASTTCAR